MSVQLTAHAFTEKLLELASPEEQQKIQRYFRSGKGEYGEGDIFAGIKMGQVFTLAKTHTAMPVSELEDLLESPIHEVRAGAMSIMDKAGRDNKIPDTRREELFNLYLRRHDRINNWDLVDLAAQYVVGRYLFSRSRDILYTLAHSANMWERRTAIVSTAYFIRQGEVTDTFAIAALLLHDTEDLIHKAVGGWIREAGKKTHRPQLRSFLDAHAATMPRTMLRYAIEHLDDVDRKHYMSLKHTR